MEPTREERAKAIAEIERQIREIGARDPEQMTWVERMEAIADLYVLSAQRNAAAAKPSPPVTETQSEG